MKMEKVAVLVLGFCGLVFAMPLLGVLFGAFSGWVVGLLFTETILGFLSRIGVNTVGLHVWQVGAAMGFLGGFLKTSTTSKSS
jgi:hypothetical protein